MNQLPSRLGLLAVCLALWACSSSDDSGQQPSNQALESAGNGGTSGAPSGGGEGGTPASGASGQPQGSAGMPSAGAAGAPSAAGAGGTAGGTTAGSGGAPSGQCKAITGQGAGGAVHLSASVPEEGRACGQEGVEICTPPAAFGGASSSTLSRCEGGQWKTIASPSACHALITAPAGPCEAKSYPSGTCDQAIDGTHHHFECVNGAWTPSGKDPSFCVEDYSLECNKGTSLTEGPIAAEGNCCREHIYCKNYELYCDGTQWHKY